MCVVELNMECVCVHLRRNQNRYSISFCFVRLCAIETICYVCVVVIKQVVRCCIVDIRCHL